MLLSVIILAKNEQDMISDCIDSAGLLSPDEILVIDNQSTDDTVSIAKKKGAKILTYQQNNFAEMRNFAKDKAKGDWILYLDADERVAHELAKEIKDILSKKVAVVAYLIPRQNYFLGQKWPHIEKITRLFYKQNLSYWFGEIHESPKVEGNVGELENCINHHTHKNLSDMLATTLVWSKIEAKLMYKAGHPQVSWWRFPRVMIPRFYDYYVKQGGWRVGIVGLIESIYQAFSVFITYARLWEIQNNTKK